MHIQRIVTPQLAAYSFLISDEASKKCAVIDPTRYVVPYLIQAQNLGYTITAILETHIHADFVSGSLELKHALNGKAAIWASGMAGQSCLANYCDKVVEEGTEINLGSVLLKALHTPGHTPEHISWLCFDLTRSSNVPCCLFSGDALFVGSVGRPDLIGKDQIPILSNKLYHTLFDTLGSLPDCVEVYPSHGSGSLCGKSLSQMESTTLGYERQFNPYMQPMPVAKWMENLVHDLPPAPPYFSLLKKLNKNGPPLLSSLQVQSFDSANCQLSKLLLIDIRLPEAYAASHLKDSLNITFNASFCKWIGWIVPFDLPIGIIAETHHSCTEAVEQLRLIGLDQRVTIINFDEIQKEYPDKLQSYTWIEPKDFKKGHLSQTGVKFLDVRTPDEWKSGHISGAEHIDLTQLQHKLCLLNKSDSLVTVCKSGARASLALSMLQKHGFKNVKNLKGGMQAWAQANLEIQKETH